MPIHISSTALSEYIKYTFFYLSIYFILVYREGEKEGEKGREERKGGKREREGRRKREGKQ